MGRTCSRCGQDSGNSSWCAKCRKAYHAEYNRNHREHIRNRAKSSRARRRSEYQERLARYLEEHPCVDCGERDIVVLEFDHVRGVKKRAICQLVQVLAGWRTIAAELRKCDVRCANCHRRRTMRLRGGYRHMRARTEDAR